MEYNELTQLWNESKDADVNISLNKKVVKELTTYKLKNSLAEIKWSSIIEIIVTLIWYVFLVGFISDYHRETQFLIPGIILIVIAIGSLILEINKLYLYFTIDHNFSIFKAQKRIERLKLMEKIDINSLYLLIPLFYVPFLLVIAKGILRIDLFELGLTNTMIASATFGGFVVAIILVFFLKKFQFKSINESLEFLKEIRE